MYSELDNIEIMINDETDEFTKTPFRITSIYTSNWIRNIDEM